MGEAQPFHPHTNIQILLGISQAMFQYCWACTDHIKAAKTAQELRDGCRGVAKVT